MEFPRKKTTPASRCGAFAQVVGDIFQVASAVKVRESIAVAVVDAPFTAFAFVHYDVADIVTGKVAIVKPLDAAVAVVPMVPFGVDLTILQQQQNQRQYTEFHVVGTGTVKRCKLFRPQTTKKVGAGKVGVLFKN